MEQHRQSSVTFKAQGHGSLNQASAWQEEPLPNLKSSLKVTDKRTDCAQVSRATEGVLLCHGSSSAAEKSPGWWLFPGQRARLAVEAEEAEGKEEGVVGV